MSLIGGTARTKLIAILLIMAILAGYYYLTAASMNTQNHITAFVGSASKPALTEAAELFEQNTGVKVELHFGGSGTVLSQMKISKEGDLYIPGSHDYMIRAVNDGMVYQDTVEIIAYLVPAIIVQEGNPQNITSIEDLARPGIRVGIADPDSVCVGEYAITILKKAGLLEEVGKNIVVHAESCSKTAALVTLGQVDAIIGWRVFERWNPDKADIVYIEPKYVPKVAAIPAAISIYTEKRDKAQLFLDFLMSEEGQQIFRKYGYIPTLEEALSYAPYAEPPNLEVVAP
jgi:molybdate transport system substrate-binding protein